MSKDSPGSLGYQMMKALQGIFQPGTSRHTAKRRQRAAIEPLTDNRVAQVHEHRPKKEYTLFCQALAAEFPQATKIRLVQDNLNTHDTSAFYENLPADVAQALAERFEFFFTPKAASWLNMIEIEFSALTRLCLDRRIPTQELLKREILSLVAQRKEKKVKISWQFSVQSARGVPNFQDKNELTP